MPLLGGFALADVPALVPRPVEIQDAEGGYTLTTAGAISAAGLENEAKLLAADLKKFTGADLRTAADGAISLKVDETLELPAGGYVLEISSKGVAITGKDKGGVFWGTRTFLQMFAPSEKFPDGGVKLAAVKIRDFPRFGWRGMHLDVGRHMFALEDIKKYIDWLAFHKMNTFHWHLSEDQGWRIEIKKWPKLTEVGAYRESSPPYGDRYGRDGKRYGGFYTQEQAKEIVAYAAARHITVVPEIDMPGHMTAAVAAYPELGNNDVPGFAPKVATRWGIFEDTLAPTEKTFQFVDDVFTEICEIFPSQYIHMGGDEAPKKQWEKSPQVQELMKKENLKNVHDVQSYFVKRVEKILESKGRKLVGWDEIREGGLSPNATVMSWRGESGGIASAKEGHDVVMSANQFLYLDYYQEPRAVALARGSEFEAGGAFLPIGKVYGFEPVSASLNEKEAKHIIGVQGQLWTEYIKDYKKAEYQAFPRLAAVAELGWSQKEGKDFQNFLTRLRHVMKFYDAAGVNYGPIYQEPVRKARDGAKAQTSLREHGGHWPESVFDGRADTFFWSNPGPNAGDHVTVVLGKPAAEGTLVSVKTGGEGKLAEDRLQTGVLEVSHDGSAWKSLAEVSDGNAAGTLPAGVSYLRIRATAPQKNWIIVRDFELK